MLEGVYGCFMTSNLFLAGNSEVSLELQRFTAELITYIVCECDAPECIQVRMKGHIQVWEHIQAHRQLWEHRSAHIKLLIEVWEKNQ